jgi:hypothetical protein
MISENLVTDTQAEEIRRTHGFGDSFYHDLDIEGTLRFFLRRYVVPLKRLVDIAACTVVDCAAGHGWFSFAYLLGGGRKAIAVDMDPVRVSASEEIARVLGVRDRMEFMVSPIQSVPLEENSAEIFVSLETLEHVGRENVRPALERISSIASRVVVVTTPNRLFPAVAHDTRLPFIHWLPPGWRRVPAKLFGRANLDASNYFLTPWDLRPLMGKFRPVSRCMTFATFGEYSAQYPFYLPYGRRAADRFKQRPNRLLSMYLRAAATIFGTSAYWVMPSLASVLVRKEDVPRLRD